MRWAGALGAILLPVALHGADLTPPDPVVALRVTEPTVAVDGVLSESTWQQGDWAGGFKQLNMSVEAPQQTRFKVRFDAQRLYLAVIADEPNPARLVRKGNQRDGPIFRDDCLEFMVDPTGDRLDYFHFIVNALGTVYDARLRDGGYLRSVEWDTEVRAAVQITEDHWTLELSVPLSALGPFAPDAEAWAFNLARARRAGGTEELSTYAHLTGGFHQPVEYVDLRLPGADLSAWRWHLSRPRGGRLAADVAGGTFTWRSSVSVSNRTGTAGPFEVRAIIGKTVGPWVSGYLAADSTTSVGLAVTGISRGKQDIQLELQSAGVLRASRRHVERLRYRPLEARILQPAYRRALYATQRLDEIVVLAHSDLRAAQLATLQIQLQLLRPTAHSVVRGSGTIAQVLSSSARPATGADTLRLEIPRLNPGRYPVRARLVDASGTVVAEAADTLRVLAPVPNEWRIEAGVLKHNGKPVLPFGWFGIPPNHMAHNDHAFVLMHSYGWYASSTADTRAFLDRVAAAGSAAAIYPYPGADFMRPSEVWGRPLTQEEEMRLRQRVADLKDHPGLFAWYLADEPELRPALPDRLRRIYQIISEEDPHHPCILLNDTVAGIYRYADAADVLMPDPYPTFLADGAAAQPISKVSRFMDAAVDAADGWRGVWITPQGFNYGDYGRRNNRAPNFDEVRNQLYQAVTHGARGFLWYTYSASANYPSLGIGMRWLSFEVARLRGAILAAEASDIITKVDAERPQDMHVSLRRDGTSQVLFAVNTAAHGQRATVQLTPAPSVDSLWVVSEGRAVALKQGAFRDSFDAYGVHIYSTDAAAARRPLLASVRARIDSFEATRKRPGNVAFEGAIVEVSSSGRYGSFPGRTVDGVRDGMRWRDDTPEQFPDWLTLRWPEPVTLAHIAVFGTPADAYVEIPGPDGWQRISAATETRADGLDLRFDAPVTAGEIRLVVHKVRQGTETIVYEIEAYSP